MSGKKAFIVIDLQKDYLWEKRKAMFSYDSAKLTENVNSAIRSYKEQGYDIIYIKHILPRILWGVGFSIKGTEGAELYDKIDVVSDLCFEKNRSNTYTSKAFREHMEKTGYDEVVLCGLDECGCVGATAKGAVRTGIKVKMLGKCIGSRFPQEKIQNMRDQLAKLGVEYI